MSNNWILIDEDGTILARYDRENDAREATFTGEFPDDVEVAYLSGGAQVMRYYITVTDDRGWTLDNYAVETEADDANTRLILRRDIEAAVRAAGGG